jgi:peptidyl-prolyl cis-trans isomerase B (cyclophilin B)
MPGASRAVCILAMAGTALVAAACGGGGEDGSTSASLPAGCEQVAKRPPKHRELKRPPRTVTRGERLNATVDTSCGRFDIRLDTAGFPRTVNSFVYLARKGFYDDTIFHRIVPHFIVQGGDPLQTGRGGPGYTVTERPPANSTYTLGTVAMAKTPVEPPGRSGSQFFIVTVADAGLPANYAILGKVNSGLDVVKRIGKLGDPASGDAGSPLETVVIRRIMIHGSG